ncbi:pilus assembly PilX family protein [Azohydromonas sediminis]|uniref:pilus assembly PilX family protein n=1 Tax=Azohydromonas sediminis TaxID=2259674 RepID=UPI000E647FDF|nr:PilX N-terminal domain-containing pilus assembly protein [Azohydromonas sediminis]
MRCACCLAARRPSAARQRGAATLVVVMALLFVVALTAAYTARNLVFEQRTAANQYRSTQAIEAAEAGIEWAIGQLNSGRIDEFCRPHDDASAAALPTSFRQRYLAIDAATSAITVRTRSDGGVLAAGCVFDADADPPSWRCSCPLDGPVDLTPPTGADAAPAFRVRFVNVPSRPGVVRVEANGCTRLDDACLAFPAQAVGGESRATVSTLVALKSALVTPPAAAVTVRRTIGGASALEAYNADAASGGLTLHVGVGIDEAPAAIAGPAGTPPERTQLLGDAAMAALTPERMFVSVFGMFRPTYREQPAALRLDCASGCSRAMLADAARLNPGRLLWIDGTADLDTSGAIGAAGEPALLVFNGDVVVRAGSDVRLHGLAYFANAGGGSAWDGDGRLVVVGGLVAEGDWTLTGTGRTVVAYDGAALARLRTTHGSFVRVPGSWKDF